MRIILAFSLSAKESKTAIRLRKVVSIMKKEITNRNTQVNSPSYLLPHSNPYIGPAGPAPPFLDP